LYFKALVAIYQNYLKAKLNINEDFICRIWEGGSLYYNDLVTDSGEEAEVLDHGRRNYDAGPDYTNAKVKIGGKTFTGDVEIHRDFKNWEEHAHPKDRRYNSVILHVVLWDSKEKTPPRLRIKRSLPTVILANHLTRSIHDIWQDIISTPSEKFRIPCYGKNSTIKDEQITAWLGKLAVERLKLRSKRIGERFGEIEEKEPAGKSQRKSIWEQVLYEFVFEALGFTKNKDQMLALAASADLKWMKKTSGGNLTAIQALLYGRAGLLFDVRVKDDYIDKIKSIWNGFAEKDKVQVLNRPDWTFFRLRPQNFPTLRIAYGSQFVQKLIYEDMFKSLVILFNSEKFNIAEVLKCIEKLFKPEHDTYWSNHYDLGKKTNSLNKLLGSQRFIDLIVNVVIPVIYLYSNEFGNKLIRSNLLKLYSGMKLKPDNNILRVMSVQLFERRNIKVNSPAMEQGTIQLHNFYCTRERCNECEIGMSVKAGSGFEYKIIYY
jgi:hypothetical protein